MLSGRLLQGHRSKTLSSVCEKDRDRQAVRWMDLPVVTLIPDGLRLGLAQNGAPPKYVASYPFPGLLESWKVANSTITHFSVSTIEEPCWFSL